MTQQWLLCRFVRSKAQKQLEVMALITSGSGASADFLGKI